MCGYHKTFMYMYMEITARQHVVYMLFLQLGHWRRGLQNRALGIQSSLSFGWNLSRSPGCRSGPVPDWTQASRSDSETGDGADGMAYRDIHSHTTATYMYMYYMSQGIIFQYRTYMSTWQVLYVYIYTCIYIMYMWVVDLLTLTYLS